jgi:hypothetical protein
MVLPQLRHESILILNNSKILIHLVTIGLILIIAILGEPTYYEKYYGKIFLKKSKSQNWENVQFV